MDQNIQLSNYDVNLDLNVDLQSFNSYIYKNKKDLINQYYETLENEAIALKRKIVEKKNWLEKQPVMQDFLNHLQFMLQEKNIGFFSSLITALADDVLAKTEETSKTINFDLSVKGGLPALKINAKTKENNIEKITSGGLKNVIATGLRVIALWRLTANEHNQTHTSHISHRKFLFMDEPDCWIGKDSMNNYAKLLHQLSNHFNLQIMMVTHNDVDYFKPYARVYKMQNNGFASVELLSDIEINKQYDSNDLNNSSETDDVNDNEINHNKDEYIKSFSLKNFKAFKDTTIELHPNLTIIVGKSDTGKSVIMEAFNAIVNNVSDDDVIRHYENKASITLEFHNKDNKDYRVLWERVKKTNTEYPQKVRYRLYDLTDNIVLNDEFNSYQTPEFVQQKLKMQKVDNVDIHLGLQDDMTFLFNPKISDYERAKILSLGKETTYINQMLDKLKAKTRETKSEIKFSENRFSLITNNIMDFLPIDENNEEYLKLKNLEDLIINEQNVLSSLSDLYDEIYFLKEINTQLSKLNILDYSQFNIKNIKQINELIDCETEYSQMIDIVKGDIKLIDVSNINQLLQEENNIKFSNISLIDKHLSIKMHSISNIDELLKSNIQIKLSKISSIDKNQLEIKLFDIDEIDNLGKEIKRLMNERQEAEKYLFDAQKEKEVVDNELEKLKHKLGICPLCGSSLH